jgi:hypothetical protein
VLRTLLHLAREVECGREDEPGVRRSYLSSCVEAAQIYLSRGEGLLSNRHAFPQFAQLYDDLVEISAARDEVWFTEEEVKMQRLSLGQRMLRYHLAMLSIQDASRFCKLFLGEGPVFPLRRIPVVCRHDGEAVVSRS